jgi:hypothetical protein
MSPRGFELGRKPLDLGRKPYGDGANAVSAFSAPPCRGVFACARCGASAETAAMLRSVAAILPTCASQPSHSRIVVKH